MEMATAPVTRAKRTAEWRAEEKQDDNDSDDDDDDHDLSFLMGRLWV